MKRNIKSDFTNLALVLTAIVALNSCVKSRDGATNFDDLQPNVLIREGGLATFSSQALTFPGTDEADTVYFRVNYAAKTVATTDVVVTLGYDESALTAYNSTATNQYTKFPDSIFAFTTTTVTIKAGQQFSDLIPMIVYPSKIDPTKNYMLPISITNASGVNISGNFGTIYYHLIGNPIAGAYEQQWIRYNASDTSGTPAFNVDEGTTIFAPVDPTTIRVTSGTGVDYVLSFTNTAGVLSDFNVTFPSEASDPGSAAANGITITGGPLIEVADPVIGLYRFYFTYLNGSGAPRVIIDEFVK